MPTRDELLDSAIKVNVDPLGGYTSAAAALAGAARAPGQPQARADGTQFIGRRLVGGRAGTDRWALEFNGPLWVEVFCDGGSYGGVGWRVTEIAPAFAADERPRAFEFPRGIRGVVEPYELFTSRVGAEFRMFWVNEGGFNVYLHGRPILAFHSVFRVDDGHRLLYAADLDG